MFGIYCARYSVSVFRRHTHRPSLDTHALSAIQKGKIWWINSVAWQRHETLVQVTRTHCERGNTHTHIDHNTKFISRHVANLCVVLACLCFHLALFHMYIIYYIGIYTYFNWTEGRIIFQKHIIQFFSHSQMFHAFCMASVGLVEFFLMIYRQNSITLHCW